MDDNTTSGELVQMSRDRQPSNRDMTLPRGAARMQAQGLRKRAGARLLDATSGLLWKPSTGRWTANLLTGLDSLIQQCR